MAMQFEKRKESFFCQLKNELAICQREREREISIQINYIKNNPITLS